MSKLESIKSKPNQSVIEYFEDILKRAKTGEIQGSMNIVLLDEGTITSGWGGLETRHHTALLGEAIQLATRMAIKTRGVDEIDINT